MTIHFLELNLRGINYKYQVNILVQQPKLALLLKISHNKYYLLTLHQMLKL